jgi:hypothetical protein
VNIILYIYPNPEIRIVSNFRYDPFHAQDVGHIKKET